MSLLNSQFDIRCSVLILQNFIMRTPPFKMEKAFFNSFACFHGQIFTVDTKGTDAYSACVLATNLHSLLKGQPLWLSDSCTYTIATDQGQELCSLQNYSETNIFTATNTHHQAQHSFTKQMAFLKHLAIHLH